MNDRQKKISSFRETQGINPGFPGCEDSLPPAGNPSQPQSLIDVVAPLDRTEMRAASERIDNAYGPVTLIPVGLAAILPRVDSTY